MYRFQYDGRLQRSLETGKLRSEYEDLRFTHYSLAAVMLMETFNRLSRKDKFAWDVSCHTPSLVVRVLMSLPDVRTCGHFPSPTHTSQIETLYCVVRRLARHTACAHGRIHCRGL